MRRGGISKAGNPRLRRILIEAAWHFQFPPRKHPNPRWEGQGPEVVAFAQKAHARLHARYRRLLRKMSTVAVTAIARELVGFVWALLRDEPSFSARGPRRRRRNSGGGGARLEESSLPLCGRADPNPRHVDGDLLSTDTSHAARSANTRLSVVEEVPSAFRFTDRSTSPDPGHDAGAQLGA